MDSNIKKIIDLLTIVDTQLSANSAAIAADVSTIATDVATIAANRTEILSDLATISTQASTITNLEAQIAQLTAPETVHFGLEKYSLFPLDKKIPFQWIQAGNTGNDGGGSPIPHGVSAWSPNPAGPTTIHVVPKNIAPKTDNFFYYMVLPNPGLATNFRFAANNYSALSPIDAASCQALEFQLEVIDGGFSRNMAYQLEPNLGIRYFNNLTQKWIQFLHNGSPVIVDISKPTAIEAWFNVNRANNTVTHQAIAINGIVYLVEVTQPSMKSAGTEYSISVQLDCKPTAPAYSAILDGLVAGSK